MTEDEEYQQLETAHTIAHLLRTQTGLSEGQEIKLDLYFKPGTDADTEGALKRLKMFGYEAEVEAEDASLSVKSPVTQLTLDAIWEHEERTTKLVGQHGFTPDGWGFWEP